MESWVQSWRPRTNVLRFFQSTCLKYCACHEKVMPGHTKCCTCHAKSSQQTWRSDASKCNHSQEISARTSSQLWWTCLLYCACHSTCIFADPLQMPHACLRFWKCHKTFTFCSLLIRSTIPCACHAKRHLNIQKWSEPLVFHILASKCVSRHNGVHFFDISTSKSGPNPLSFLHFWLGNALRATKACTFDISSSKSGPRMVCVVHFDIEKCFAPQRRALFRHLKFQKWSENGVLCTFWLRNMLRATTACTFSTSQLPKAVRCWGVLCNLTGKCASHHNGVQFFMSHLASWLRTRRFSEPTFRPSGATNHRKNTVFRDFPTFSGT